MHLDRLVGAAGVQVGHGEVVAAGERVGVVGAEPCLAQLQGALVLPDRQRGITQVRVRAPQRVADVRLDDRLILERLGDLRLGGVDRLADRHLHAQATLLSLGSGGREDVVLEEAQHGLGSLARLLRLRQCLRAFLASPLVWRALAR